jgi:hypothetical protein
LGGGEVEVVDRSQCRVAESADQAEDLQLVADVEVVGGLVEQVQVAALGEGAGDEDALLLPTGERGVAALVGAGHADPRQRVAADRAVLAGVAVQRSLVRGAAERDDLLDREVLVGEACATTATRRAAPSRAGATGRRRRG